MVQSTGCHQALCKTAFNTAQLKRFMHQQYKLQSYATLPSILKSTGQITADIVQKGQRICKALLTEHLILRRMLKILSTTVLSDEEIGSEVVMKEARKWAQYVC